MPTQGTPDDATTPEVVADNAQEATGTTGETTQETTPKPTETNTNTNKTDNTADINTEIKRLRKENAHYRTKFKNEQTTTTQLQTQLDTLLKGLSNLTGNTQETSIEDQLAQVTKERDQANTTIANLKAQTTITNLAHKHGADANLLTPYLKGSGQLDNINPTDDDYTTQVEAIIVETLNNNPVFKTHKAAASSGTPTPNPEAHKTITRDDLTRLAQEGKWAEINRLVAENPIS